jgi:hypothetical protein
MMPARFRFTPESGHLQRTKKQTCAVREGMSALPPKADMCGATSDVRFGSKADMCVAKSNVRFDPNSDRESGFPQKVISASPPKADMCSALTHVG